MTVARDASRAAVAFAGVNPILRVMKISTQPLTMGGYSKAQVLEATRIERRYNLTGEEGPWWS